LGKEFFEEMEATNQISEVESEDVSKQAIESLSDRISQLETTTEKLILYINQKIP